MATKIQPIQKSKTIDYGNEELLNFWKEKSIPKQSNHRNNLANTLKNVSEGIVCIQSESLTNKDLIKQIFDIANNLKVRFYILVNDYSQELDSLNGICLIRYEVKNKGSFVLVNPNSDYPKGLFFTGQLTEQSIAVSQHILRELNSKETEELYRHFCYHFWETAKKEVIEKGKRTEVISKPLDIFHDTNAFDGKDFVYGTLFDFSEQAKRSELSGKQIIYLNKETHIPIEIKASSTLSLNDNISNSLLPKNEFESQEPNFVDDGVSVSIEYQWQNVPFYLPEKATDNSIYDKWKKKQEEITKALGSILNKIQEAEKKEASLSKAILRFFLGKKNVFGALKNEIEDLKATDFANQSEVILKEKINHINEINVQVQNEIGEIETEDRKAKLDEEISNLKTQISEQEVALEIKKQELTTKKQDKEQQLANFLLDNNIEKDKLNAQKGIWEQQAGKKNKEKNPEEANIAEKKLRELKEIENPVFISKTESEIKEIEKKINSLNNQINSKEKEKNKLIQQSGSSSLDYLNDKNANQSNPPKSQLVQFPDLQQLPTVGKLYQVNSQPYLAIQFWEEYEQGKKESERLKAALCTIKN